MTVPSAVMVIKSPGEVTRPVSVQGREDGTVMLNEMAGGKAVGVNAGAGAGTEVRVGVSANGVVVVEGLGVLRGSAVAVGLGLGAIVG